MARDKEWMPPSLCGWCEYFDGGGEKLVQIARAGQKLLGDCGNRMSPRFTTFSDDSCPEFFPDSMLWVDPKGPALGAL